MTSQLVVGTRKGLFTVNGANGAWQTERAMFLGVPVVMTLSHPDGRWYAVLDHGHFGIKFHRSDDYGETWEEISTPAYPERPADATDVDPMRNVPIPWTLKGVWSLEFARADSVDHLWCGTLPGGLFYSSNGGASWQLNRALWDHPKRGQWFGGGADWPGIHSICVDPRDHNALVIAVSCGGVWHSTDSGQSWYLSAKGMRADYLPPESIDAENNQDAHRIVRSPSQPDRFWCQHHNGIFVSDDNGHHWQSIETVSPSAFGFSVVCDPEDPETAWFIPAVKDEARYPVDGRLVVTRTQDGGKNFEVLSDGLPQAHCYDLIYRHAFDIAADGTRLAFGSTTGALWTSGNRGEKWQLQNAHLPPVYSVRFA